MARKKKRGRPQRQRRRRQQQRQQYEELDKYPVLPPHAFARIVRDLRTLNILYQVIEPPLTKKEQEQFEEILDIFVRSLTADIAEIDADPVAYLRAAMDQIIKSYSMRVNKKSRSKIFYYLKRDLIGYGRMDVLMNDANVEDISLDGVGIPIFAYHRLAGRRRIGILCHQVGAALRQAHLRGRAAARRHPDGWQPHRDEARLRDIDTRLDLLHQALP